MLEIIPSWEQIDQCIALSEQYGLAFEYNDFYAPEFLDDGAALKKRIADYRSMGRPVGVDTMHGVFYDILPFSLDKGVREHGIDRMRQSVEIAEELGCRAVVFHTNLTPFFLNSAQYRQGWLESMRKTILEILKNSSRCEIYVENMLDDSPAELLALAQALEGERRFGVCLDVAHMMLQPGEPEKWFKALSPYIRHFHLNDTHLKYDEHLPLGQGLIDWQVIFGLMKKYNLEKKSILLEVKGLDKISQSLEYCRKMGVK